jgi:hypothetical protein
VDGKEKKGSKVRLQVTRYTFQLMHISVETERVKHMNIAEDYKEILAFFCRNYLLAISIAETEIRLLKSLVYHTTCEWLEINPIHHCRPIRQLYMARPAKESVITCRPSST